LSELIWEAYVHINAFFGLTAFVKLYENRYGVSWGIPTDDLPATASDSTASTTTSSAVR
jgi:hypothetical protein